MNINVLKQLNEKRAKGFFFFFAPLSSSPPARVLNLNFCNLQRRRGPPGGHSARRRLYPAAAADYVITRAIRTRGKSGRGCPARGCREIHYDIMSFPRRGARSDRAFVASLRDRDSGIPPRSLLSPFPPPAPFGLLMSAAATRGIKVHSYLKMVIPREIAAACVDLIDRSDGSFSFFSLLL